ncbi:MAG: helix-turn-helix domain-containing protein [Acidimicrobiales bacterium]|nr:helix-turn-helix domain-containing protein [Acidimicrobiales bacterium]
MTAPAGSDEAYCARFHYAIELIGRRWTGAILIALGSGRDRYSEVREAIPGLSDRMLCDRLRELEGAGLVRRDVAPTTPVNVRYQLTDKGQALGPVLAGLSAWAGEWVGGVDEPGPTTAPHSR